MLRTRPCDRRRELRGRRPCVGRVPIVRRLRRSLARRRLGADVGRAPQYVARFEAFSRGATVDAFLREAERQGLRRVLVSWEPWRPVPDELGVAEQFRPQPGYRNADIAAGAQDAYIDRFASSLATFPGRVDLRYAHEMNGTWYPWSHDPVAYRRAWRHVVRLVRCRGRATCASSGR